MSRTFLLWGSINALLAIVPGAFGAHTLTSGRPRRPVNRGTAAQYPFYHALDLLALGQLSHELPASKSSLLFDASRYDIILQLSLCTGTNPTQPPWHDYTSRRHLLHTGMDMAIQCILAPAAIT